MAKSVKCVVKVGSLVIGNEAWQKEQVEYTKGDVIEIPKKKALSLGNSVEILPKIETPEVETTELEENTENKAEGKSTKKR